MSKSEKKDEKGMGEPIAATHPDPIPPVHVLEAAQDQEKKETEDLLAGFDRPGRGPKKPAEERDFVEYFTKKKSDPRMPTPTPGAVRASAQPTRPKQAEISTVVVPREKKSGLGTWLAAGAIMIALGGVVAFVATKDESKPVPSVGAATTITNASPPPTTRTSKEDIPPPPPATEVAPPATIDPSAEEPPNMRSTANVPPTTSAKKREPKSAGSGSAGAAPAATTPVTSTGSPMVVPSTKPPPRDDLIRGM